jgi:hypothetical protein
MLSIPSNVLNTYAFDASLLFLNVSIRGSKLGSVRASATFAHDR